MSYTKLGLRGAILLFFALTSVSCPSGTVGTFKVYIVNLSAATIDDVSMRNQQTSMFESVADNDVAPGTMMELNVSKSVFQTDSGTLRIHVAGGQTIAANGLVLGPSPVVLYYKSIAESGIIDYELG